MRVLEASPDAALFTLLAGILLLYLEANRPGRVLPGCLGLLLVLCSLHALAARPFQPWAAGAVFAAFVLTLASLLRPTETAWALGGACLLALGLRKLLLPPARIHLSTALFFSAGLTLSTVWLGRVAARARRNKQVTKRGTASPPTHAR